MAQEPRKAEAPQLRDECRSYRILTHCRVLFFNPSYHMVVTDLVSWHSSNIPFWTRGIAQRPGH